MKIYLLLGIFLQSAFLLYAQPAPDTNTFPRNSGNAEFIVLDLPEIRKEKSVNTGGGGHELEGIASWYGTKFQGRLTANGEKFDTNLLTAAHKTLPFNTTVRVSNLSNKKTVTVRINDRGPFVPNRIIDLSRAAANVLDMIHSGTASVKIDIIKLGVESPLRMLQISAFSDVENAEALQKELHQHGFSASIERSNAIHRVIIRNVHSNELAGLQTQLAAIGYDNTLIRKQ